MAARYIYAPTRRGTAQLLANEDSAGNSVIVVSGQLVSVSDEITRPANTTGYSIGDVVSDDSVLTFPNFAAAAGNSGFVVGASLVTDLKSITPRIRVHLFNATPTVSLDNAAHKELYADVAKRVGYFDLAALSTPVDTTNSTLSRVVDFTIRIPFVSVTRSLIAVLETLDAFTPASGQKFTLTLWGDLN